MEVDPAPRVLLAHTFDHQQLCEHVDEVRFTEAVLLSGCEVLELQGSSACSDVPVLGETYPASFSLEIFARIRGESRFRPVCAAFVYSPSSGSSLDLQVIVTDHLVMRGIYSTVTLVIYGIPVRDLNPTPFTFQPEHPSPVPHTPKRDILQSEHPSQADFSNRVRRLVRLAAVSPKCRAALVTAALSYRKLSRSLGRGENYDQMLSSMAQVAEESEKQDSGTFETEVFHTVLSWVREGLHPREGNAACKVNNFLTGLATIQLLCMSTRECLKFVLAGVIDVLIEVLQAASTVSPVALSLALQALEISSRHAFGCDAVLGWGKPPRPKKGYATILLTLVQASSPSLVQLSVQVLHRFRVYELAATFQATVDYLLISKLGKNEKSVITATTLLKIITNVLHLKNDVTFPMHASRFLHMEFEDDGLPLDNPYENVDEHILVILQERRLISSIAAFMTLNDDRSKNHIKFWTETLDTVQTLLLSLLRSPSGTFLLYTDPDAARAVSAVLKKRCRDQMTEESTICSIQSKLGCNKAFHPWDIEKLLQTSLSAVDIFQRLQSSIHASKENLWCLWKLALLSRTQIGRRAMVINFQDPEALLAVFEVLDSATATPEKLLAASYAAEILYVVLSDSTLAVWTAWRKHGTKLKETISNLKAVEDDLSETGLFTTRLQLVADAALVYQDKGVVGLLKFAAFLAGENSSLDLFDINTAMVDEHDASSLLGKVDGSSGFNDSTLIQLTACMQILATVCGSSLAAGLYAEGAVTVVTALLERSSFMLQDDFEHDDFAAFSILTSVMKLLVPTFLLLSTLFQRLQLERRQYHNTKLVMLLLQLHCVISGKSLLVPTYSRESAGIEMRAVLRLLAAVLAFWLVFGWDPVIPPRIFRSYVNGSLANSELPLDPVETCSSLILLGNLLPLDDNICSCWDLAVEVTLGTTVIPQVTWHTQTPFKEALSEALAPHYHYFADLIPRLALSTSEILRDLLKHVVVRLSCVNPSLSAGTLRPLLTYIEERTSAAAHSSDADVLHVLCCIEFVTELAKFPASKAVLLQEGIVKILFQALVSFFYFRTEDASNCIRSLLTCLTTLCDPKYFPSFDIISSFKRLLKELPLEHDFITLMHVFYKFSSHRLGKIAFLKTHLDESSTSLGKDGDDNTKANVTKRHDEPLLMLSQRLIAALSVESAHDSTLLEITRAFAVGALRLAAAGKSSLGMGALSTLFGRHTSDDKAALLAISDLISCLNRNKDGVDESKCARQAIDALQVLLRLLQRPLQVEELLGKLKAGKLEKPVADHERSSTNDAIAVVIPSVSVLEKHGDRFSWEVSSEVIETSSRPPKRKPPFSVNDSSKRAVRSRTSATEAPHSARANTRQHVNDCVEKEEIPGDTPSASGGPIFGHTETSNDDEDSPTLFSSTDAFEGQSAKEFQDEPTTRPTSISPGTVHYQAYPQVPLFAPSPQPPFMPTPQQLSQHFHLQHQLMQFRRTPPEGYAGYHQQQGQQQAVQTQTHHESWNVLQQILASPESLQDLLRDQARLTMLLEQHPKLLSLLQERFNFSS